jgi:hypothetical protein
LAAVPKVLVTAGRAACVRAGICYIVSMSNRRAFLLSPYALPTDHPMMLAEPEMAAWWNGYLALWHPAVLAGLAEPPKQASQYDHENPQPGHVYARPDAPELYMPDDWKLRVEQAPALSFAATADRAETLANLKQAYPAFDTTPEGIARIELPAEKVRPFLAVGFGYLVVEHLFDAMQHEHLLASGEFWADVQNAVTAVTETDPNLCLTHLRAAAEKLLAARQVLYPVAVHLLDFVLPDERKLADTLPRSFAGDTPLNLIASGSMLERVRDEFAERFAEVKQRVGGESPTIELCTGGYREREDAVLPVESQLWNLREGRRIAKELLGVESRVFARRRGAWSPQTPQFLLASGFEKAILLAFDGSVVPTHRSTVVNWSAPDGKQLDAFTRAPQPAHQAQTFFNIVHSLHETIMQDTAATFALVHNEGPPSACYDDWRELSRLAPVLGQWTTISRFLSETSAGEYAPASTADDFFTDYLEDRTTAHLPNPVSGFARHLRQRRRLDTSLGLLAILRALGPGSDEAARKAAAYESDLGDLERKLENGVGGAVEELPTAEKATAQLLADRLQSRATADTPGFMLLNPCSFARRLSLELTGMLGPIPVEGPVKAMQFDPDKARLVVEVPAFGFLWLPQGSPDAAAPKPRMKLADNNAIRNEFLEAEIDPATGGLKALRDPRTRANRLGQQLVFNPGSRMVAKSVKVTANGAALGEITSEGAILNEHDEVLASFRQRFRAWLGRPLLDLRVEIFPEKSPEGYPWHAYYAARFAWRDERASLSRGSDETGYITTHTRPVSPEFLEIRYGDERTTIFPAGLPFLQRHGGRMVDVILVPEREETKAFDISLGFDREYPAQTALGLATPTTVVPTTKGPPHIGPSGWLFHLDAPNLVLTGLRPARPPASGGSAIELRLLESTGFGGTAELRCVRNPSRACTLDAAGEPFVELTANGDAVTIDYLAGDLLRIRVEFP